MFVNLTLAHNSFIFLTPIPNCIAHSSPTPSQTH